ncbi:hypothetical protein O3P69_007148 [Scylla paramamosain]|uniref:Uncharacterized protein n=1 Tax=Scylla paramamosain TaxID=85552 RepID=A0AAW0V1L2_SCYPA
MAPASSAYPSVPDHPSRVLPQVGDPEVKKEVTTLTLMVQESHEQGVMEKLLRQYSSWYGLQRAVAWVCRFTTWIMKGRPSLQSSQLQDTELQAAQMAIIRHVQRKRFRDAIQALQRGKLPKGNALYRLEWTLDDQGVLRQDEVPLTGSSLTEDPTSKEPPKTSKTAAWA